MIESSSHMLQSPGMGRPTEPLPLGQLVRISLYWLGPTSIFTGLTVVLSACLLFDALDPGDTGVGVALVRLTVVGALIAMIVQPTVGMISDYQPLSEPARSPRTK